MLHSPLVNQQQILEVWQVMESIVNNGGIKQLGISNCYDLKVLEDLYRSAEIKPAVLQNRFYADTQYDPSIREFCRQRGIIYQSFWTLTANPRVLADPLTQGLANNYRRTAAQVFFRYLTQIGVIPLTGTVSAIHMREDLAIFEFELTPDECSALATLF